MTQQGKRKVAVVTGGSRGLGREVCLSLGREGVFVVAADTRRQLAEETIAQLISAGGQGAALAFDVSDPFAAEGAFAEITSEYGRLDILVNNAGIDRTVSIEEMTLDEWNRIIATNLSGPFILSRLALPIMKKQGAGGSIINIVSTAAKRAWPNASAYHASKWGLLGFSHALHTEARPFGIKVSAIICGGMRTPFLLERFPDIDQSTLQDPAHVAETICALLKLPSESVVAEITVLPLAETSWP